MVEVDDTGFSGGSYWSRGAGGVWKRMRLTRKTNSSELRRFGDFSILHSRRWKRLCPFGDVHDVSGKRGCLFITGFAWGFHRVGVG